MQRAGDVGLEIAPGNEVEDLALIEDVGNIWNHVRGCGGRGGRGCRG